MNEPVDITLREVTKDTLDAILGLKVHPAQERFVASNAKSIAQAHFHDDAWYRAIYADDEPVGFVMLSLVPEQAEYFVWRFMIGAEHQGRGYGRRALALVIEFVRTLPNATELYISHADGEGGPGPFYEKLGFAYTGEKEEGEALMRLALGA